MKPADIRLTFEERLDWSAFALRVDPGRGSTLEGMLQAVDEARLEVRGASHRGGWAGGSSGLG